MNIEKLKIAEMNFFRLHPEGFDDPSMQTIAKRHAMDKMVEFAKENLAKDCRSHVDKTVGNMVQVIGRSSMAYMFEKPRFK